MAGGTALLLPTLEGGGAERVILTLGDELHRRGHPATVVVGTRRGALVDQATGSVPIHDLGRPRMRNAVGPLVRWLRVNRPRILLSALPEPNLVAILAARMARTGTRVIATVHNHPAGEARTATGVKDRLVLRVAPHGYRLADHIVCVSTGVAANLCELTATPHAKVSVVYNPVVSPITHRQSLDPPQHPWMADGGPPVITGVGRLVPQKDFPTLIRAVALLPGGPTPPPRLVILGEGPERPRLEALVRSLGLQDRVDLPGFVDNVHGHLRHSAVLASSSRHEGFGNALVEALAVGTPVVSTDCPSGPSEILAHGRYGTLVPVGDPAALADAIARTLATPPDPELLTRRGQSFTVAAATDRYLELFDRLAPA